MTFNSLLLEPTQLYLELSAATQTHAWQQSQSYALPASRWNAYLNQVCLTAFLSWLREEQDSRARVWPHPPALPSFWEVVNGTAIALSGVRLVLIPSEAADLSELRVPQEWVDIPSWAGDYYLAVQVNPGDSYMRVWGYCTHQQLQTAGDYDAGDRTYSINEDDLICDLSVLWVARQICPEEATRAALAPLPTLSLAQAENLLQRLGTPSVLVPRLTVPFHLWGALLEHGGWRQRLAERRCGLPEQRSVLQWLQTNVSHLAQQFGWRQVELQPSGTGARGEETTSSSVVLSRQLLIAGQSYELRLLPLESPDARVWRFELQNLSPGGYIPIGFKLRLLTENLQPFENNEDAATTVADQLYIDVALEPGEGLVWEVEPTPDNYNQEILRF